VARAEELRSNAHAGLLTRDPTRWSGSKPSPSRVTPSAKDELYGGWPMILSGLKTWLETGESLTTPGSLLYG
jgi:hypothetical protein